MSSLDNDLPAHEKCLSEKVCTNRLWLQKKNVLCTEKFDKYTYDNRAELTIKMIASAYHPACFLGYY